MEGFFSSMLGLGRQKADTLKLNKTVVLWFGDFVVGWLIWVYFLLLFFSMLRGNKVAK